MKISKEELPLLANALTQIFEFENKMAFVYSNDIELGIKTFDDIMELYFFITYYTNIKHAIFVSLDTEDGDVTIISGIGDIIAYIESDCMIH